MQYWLLAALTALAGLWVALPTFLYWPRRAVVTPLVATPRPTVHRTRRLMRRRAPDSPDH